METHFPTGQPDSHEARERVMTDLKTLLHDSEDLLRATAGDMSVAAKDARARLTAALERARASCAAWQEQSLECARRTARKTDETIRSHPYESIGIAFGVGLLLGVVLKRR